MSSTRSPRVWAVVAIAAALALAGCGSAPGNGGGNGAGGAASRTVTVGLYAGNLLPPQVAQAKGYFASRGITVQLKTLAAGPAIASAAASGSIDIGFGDTLAWAAAVGNGFHNLSIVQGGDVSGPNLKSDEHLLARAGAGISSPADLTGRTIGIIPYPEINVAARLWLKKHGVDPNTVKFVSVQDGTQAALLRTGGVDVVEGRNIGEDRQLVAQEGALDLGEVFTAQPDNAVATAYFADKSWLAANQDLARDVVTAFRQGTDYIRTAPPTELAALATRYAGVNYPRLKKQYPGITEQTSWAREQPAVFDAQAIARTNEWINDAVSVGQLARPVDVNQYLWSTATAANPD